MSYTTRSQYGVWYFLDRCKWLALGGRRDRERGFHDVLVAVPGFHFSFYRTFCRFYAFGSLLGLHFLPSHCFLGVASPPLSSYYSILLSPSISESQYRYRYRILDIDIFTIALISLLLSFLLSLSQYQYIDIAL